MKNTLLFGILACLVVILALGGALFFLGKPQQAQINSAVKKFGEIPSVLRGEVDISALVGSLEKNGEVPVTLPPDKVGREDPFAGL